MPTVTSGSFRKVRDAMVGLILTSVAAEFRDLADLDRIVPARYNSVAPLLGVTPWLLLVSDVALIRSLNANRFASSARGTSRRSAGSRRRAHESAR
jgi:hypothetical protein